MRNWTGRSHKYFLTTAFLSVAVVACSSDKYSSWSECFSQEVKESGDYKVSLFFCNSNYEKTNEEILEFAAAGLNDSLKTLDVRMPNGQVIKNVPTTLTQKQILRVLEASGYDVNALLTPTEPTITNSIEGNLDYNK
ncbi:MAG: hypothetical protein ACKOW8_03990 [Flavobacteriales bacterium]